MSPLIFTLDLVLFTEEDTAVAILIILGLAFPRRLLRENVTHTREKD